MTVGDRVKLPLAFDVSRMQAEIRALPLHEFIHYSVLPLTTPKPKPKSSEPVDDYADGSWANWLDTSLLEACPYLTSIVRDFRSKTDVTLVRLLRLAPGGVVAEHTDPTLGLEQERSVIRLTIPIVGNDGATMFVNDEPVPMQAGECWYLRFSDPHRVVNESDMERINMSIDMIPNDWVRSMIEEAANGA